LSSDGGACGKCTKCFRREVVRGCVNDKFIPSWANFETEVIEEFLAKRPLYFGHIFSYARKKEFLTEWIEEKISDVHKINTDWPNKYYPAAKSFVPEKWQDLICNRIDENFEMMNEEEVSELKNWNQSENDEN